MYVCKFLKTTATLNRIRSLCAVCGTFVLEIFFEGYAWEGREHEDGRRKDTSLKA